MNQDFGSQSTIQVNQNLGSRFTVQGVWEMISKDLGSWPLES